MTFPFSPDDDLGFYVDELRLNLAELPAEWDNALPVLIPNPTIPQIDIPSESMIELLAELHIWVATQNHQFLNSTSAYRNPNTRTMRYGT
jgi:hypothetical protein